MNSIIMQNLEHVYRAIFVLLLGIPGFPPGMPLWFWQNYLIFFLIFFFYSSAAKVSDPARPSGVCVLRPQEDVFAKKKFSY